MNPWKYMLRDKVLNGKETVSNYIRRQKLARDHRMLNLIIDPKTHKMCAESWHNNGNGICVKLSIACLESTSMDMKSRTKSSQKASTVALWNAVLYRPLPP